MKGEQVRGEDVKKKKKKERRRIKVGRKGGEKVNLRRINTQ